MRDQDSPGGLAGMRWLNEPRQWSFQRDRLFVRADPHTDFWRTTHYGYIRDTGHLYGTPVPGDGTLVARVSGAFRAQYDQAGVMARTDGEHWVKAGIEWYDGLLRLSTVATNAYSSWAFSDLPAGTTQIWLRLRRMRDAVEVSSSCDGGNFAVSALAYLPAGRTALLGLACAAPEGPGFAASFRGILVRQGAP